MKIKNYLSVAIFLCFLFTSSAAWAADFYCDCSDAGDTSSVGSWGDKFGGVAAINAYETGTGFADGDDIYFAQGSTCTSTAPLNIKWNGTGASNYSIIGCYDAQDDFVCTGTRPILQKSGGKIIFYYDDVEYIEIRYLNLRNTDAGWEDDGNSTGISTDSDGADPDGGNGNKGYLRILDNIFYHFGHYAVALANTGPHIIITGNSCTWSGNCFYIINEYTDGPSYGYIADNICEDIVGYYSLSQEEKVDGHCVGLQTTDYFIVKNNDSTDAYNVPYILWVKDTKSSIHNVFAGNVSDGNRQVNVSLHHSLDSGDSGSWGNLIYRNIGIDDANSTSLRPSLRISGFSGVNGNYFFNNTTYNSGYWGLQNRKGINYSRWFNNIVVTSGVGSNDDQFYVETGGQGTDHLVQNNLFWTTPNTDPSSYTLWMSPEDGAAFNFANWEADDSDIKNNVVGNPDFVDFTDFGLQGVSPARNAARFLTNVTSASNTNQSTVNVANTYILHHDFGILDGEGNPIEGMLISLYDTTYGIQDVEITNISYGTSITVSPNISWIYDGANQTDPTKTTQISLRMKETAPDIGAVEYDAGGGATQGSAKINFSFSGTGVIDYDSAGTGKLTRE